MKRQIMKEASTMFVGLMFLFAGALSYMLLAFAFRDFSWLLLAQFILTPIGIPLGWYLLQKGARADFKKPMAYRMTRVNNAIKGMKKKETT
jgi:uncharacterized membrane protein HdeD (DUF308 family)